MVKKAESFAEVNADAIKARKLEDELKKTKEEKEKLYDDFMEYKYDHMPSEIKRGLEKCYKLLTGEYSIGIKRKRFKIEFMEFCEWNCVSKNDYIESKKRKECGLDVTEFTKIELPFDD